MAATASALGVEVEAERKQHEICLHHAYEMWTEQKRAYLSQQTVNFTWRQGHADEVFALHILAVHSKFCTEPLCGGGSTATSRSNTGLSFSRSPSSPGPLNSGYAVPSHSARKNATVPYSNTLVVNAESGITDSGTTNAHDDEHQITVTVAIGDEDVTSQDALSDVTENVPSEESQVTDDEYSGWMKIKTEPEDTYEDDKSDNESCQVTSDLPDVSCDQQRELMTDMMYEVKYEDDGHFEGNPDQQLEGSLNTPGRSVTLPNFTTETQDHIPTRSKCTDFSGKLCKCHMCHKVLRSNDSPPRTSQYQEDSPMFCDVCQKGFGHADGIKDVHESDIDIEKSTEDHARFQASNDMTARKCSCQISLKTFPKSRDSNKQMQTHINENPYIGEICQSSVNVKSNTYPSIGEDMNPSQSIYHDTCTSELATHMRISDNGEKQHICNTCSKGFEKKTYLNKHMRTHTEEKPYECDLCLKAFYEKSHLNSHMRTHSRERPYKCDMCLKAFYQKSQLNRHMRMHTGGIPYNCNLCSKSFRDEYDLSSHMRTHTGEKPHECYVCSKAFYQKGNLNRHMRTHTGEKPYKCDICLKAFCEKGQLTAHMRMHTGEKPYNCNLCSKAFRHKGNLKLHIRIHTGEKPHKCNMCSKAFLQAGSLNIHMRTHTGERPYKCDLCSKTFQYKGNLKTHMKKHSSDKPHKCNVCSKTFKYKSCLTSHILRTHTGEKSTKI